MPIVLNEPDNLLVRWNRLRNVSLHSEIPPPGSPRASDSDKSSSWWFISVLFHDSSRNSTKAESYSTLMDSTLRDVVVLALDTILIMIMLVLAYYSVGSYKFTQPTVPHDSLVAPGKFEKKSGSFVSFLDQMNRFFLARPRLDDRQRSETLRSRLDIDANAFIDNSFLSERVEAPDYQALCTALLTYYGSGDSSDAVSQQHLFASLLQREDESPYQYFAALNKLGHNAYPRLSVFDRDDIIANRYMRGLIDDGLRRALLSDYNPNSMEKSNMYMQTRKYEGFTRTQRIGTYSLAPCPCVAAQRLVNDARIKINCSMCRPPSSKPNIGEVGRVLSNALSLQEQRSCYKFRLPGHLACFFNCYRILVSLFKR